MFKRFLSDFIIEIISAMILVVLVLTLINPFKIFMPSTTEMGLIVGLVVLFGVFASFVWRENILDEREAMLRMMADRFGFLAGAGVLILAIVVEGLRHQLSDWLLVAFAAMILAKITAIIYGKSRH